MFRSLRTAMVLLATIIVVALCVSAVWAADTPGTLQGVVKSAAGEAPSGAFVQLIKSEKRLTFLVVTEAQGRYAASDLPPGKYTVQGIGNGFQSMPKSVSVAAGKP